VGQILAELDQSADGTSGNGSVRYLSSCGWIDKLARGSLYRSPSITDDASVSAARATETGERRW
jgi:hypothetical protein